MSSFLPSIATFALLSASAPAALVLHYAFDEGSGTVVTDSSGNGRDSALSGTWNASGVFGGSVNLGSTLARTGSSYESTITSLQTVTGNQVTIAFWAQPTTESVGSNPFTMTNSNNSEGTRLFSSHLEWTNGQTYFDAAWGASTSNRINGDIGLVADAMHHYVYTYDGDAGEMFLYKDNVQVLGSTTVPGGALDWAGIQNFQLGALSFVNGSWTGEMDDFAIWNEVLDTATRTSVFQNGVIPEPSASVLIGIAGFGLLIRRRP